MLLTQQYSVSVIIRRCNN